MGTLKTLTLQTVPFNLFRFEGDVWQPLPKLKELEGIKVGDSIRANPWIWKIQRYRGQLRGMALQWIGRESGAGLLKKK